MECRDALECIAIPVAPSGQAVWRCGDEPLELTAVTRLIVLGGSLQIALEQRRFLTEIDRAAFDRLPPGTTLHKSFALKRVRFSRNLGEIPDRFLEDCGRLVDVNSEECQSLERVGEWAFCSCWQLREVLVPGVARRSMWV
jgi:hypothetical protein